MTFTDSSASYWTSLAASQTAGTAWLCRCGESNPGDYDTCHFCQQSQPATEPARGDVFVPGADDMAGEFAGVLVASIAEGEGVIALTGRKDRALAAIDQYLRTVSGQPNILDDANRPLTDAYFDLDCGYAAFHRFGDGSWEAMPAPHNTPLAIRVTWFYGATPGPLPDPYARQDGGPLW